VWGNLGIEGGSARGRPPIKRFQLKAGGGKTSVIKTLWKSESEQKQRNKNGQPIMGGGQKTYHELAKGGVLGEGKQSKQRKLSDRGTVK